MPRKGQHQPVKGEIYAGGLLTVHGVMRAIGIGRDQLREAREAGVVKAYPCGGTYYYRTDEVIEWILQGGSKSVENKQGASS